MPSSEYKVDYSGLVVAFETRGKLKYFFDKETGDVSGYYPQGRPEDAPKVAACESEPQRFVSVPAETPEINLGDRRAFARTIEKPNLRNALDASFDAPEPLLAFREILRQSPAEEGRWFRLKEERVRSRVSAWLLKNELPPFPSPPKRY